jgi:hypothetical protein
MPPNLDRGADGRTGLSPRGFGGAEWTVMAKSGSGQERWAYAYLTAAKP